MDGIEGLLARDFGVRPQGKAAPMAAARGGGSAWANPRSTPAPTYDGLFGEPGSAASDSASASGPSLDSIFFDSFKGTSSSTSAAAAAGTKPAFDDDFFNPVGGLRPSNSTSSTARYDSEDVFGTGTAPAYDDVFMGSNRSAPPSYDDFLGGFSGKPQVEEMKRSPVVENDDLLGGFGMKPAGEKTKPVMEEEDQQVNGFDDLIPGFSGISPPKSRKTSNDNTKKASVSTSKSTASMVDDPFVILEGVSAPGSSYPSPGRFTDPLEDLDEPVNTEGKNSDSTGDDALFEDSSTFDQVPKTDPVFTSDTNGYNKDSYPQSKAQDSRPVQSSAKRNSGSVSLEDFVNGTQKSQSARYSDIHVDASSERYGGNGMEDQSPISTESEDDIWLTVSEIPLFTRPSSAPPPSRSPPLLKQKPLAAKANGKDDECVQQSSQKRNHHKYSPEQADVYSVDEEDVAMGKPQRPAYYGTNAFDDDEEYATNSSARDERESQERLEKAQEMRLREEQRRHEKEKELEQQRVKQAVERATKEARERAAAEVRAKAERDARQRSQRAAVQRAHQEARERAAAEAKDRVARAAAEEKERVTAEAKERERAAAQERAAAEAKERERTAARERATAERAATERVQQEARKRAERAAVERAAAEARERHAAAAAAAATAAAKEKQSTPDDLDSFFSNSAPKQRAPTVESTFDFQPQSRGTVNGSQRAATTSASTRKATNAPSATNIFGNGLSDLFEFEPRSSSDVFQDVEGESEERRRARLERHQRTRERAVKALAEKNERDMQVQREQAERDRIGDSLDFEIKRWAAGKESNLRALLSTLQYILWAECGWQAVSLTDLITGAAVKKQYRKATLCIHPDKVQQKGATLQQKYIAEKVFDMLKEAWNKFNSEELF